MTADDFSSLFERRKKTARGWKVACPCHEDSDPSLDIEDGDRTVLVLCRAGCKVADICASRGLSVSDLFYEQLSKNGNGKHTANPPLGADSFSWSACVAAVTPELIKRELVQARGLSIEFCAALKAQNLIGGIIDPHGKKELRLAFPVSRNGGAVLGCHYVTGLDKPRFRCWPEGQGMHPWIIGEPTETNRAFIFESQWDCFRVLDELGFHRGALNKTCSVVTRGAGNGKLLRGLLPPDSSAYAFRQNDQADAKSGKIPSDTWLTDVCLNAGCRVSHVETPAGHGDVDEWIKSGATMAHLTQAIESAIEKTPAKLEEKTSKLIARSIFDLQRPAKDDPNELLMYRYLCRKGILLFCAPTGVGKSVWVMQAMVLWALGKSFLGIVPSGPLKSLLIQGENDEIDLVEMRDGVCGGLKLTDTEKEQVKKMVLVWDEQVKTGGAFLLEVVEPLLKEHRPDLLWLDPIFQYLGGSAAKQEEVSPFIRNGLSPLLKKYNVGCVIIHHTNKPPRGEEKAGWSGSDLAYIGSGSIEWANTARAVIAMQSIGQHDKYKLVAGKRGARLRWKNEAGEKVFQKLIGHSEDPAAPYWIELDESPVGRPKGVDEEDLVKLLPPQGLESSEWQKKALKEWGVSKATFFRRKRELVEEGRVLQSSTNDRWQPVRSTRSKK